MPVPAKPAHLSQRRTPRKAKTVLAVIPGVEVPAPPRSLSPRSVARWESLWRSALSQSWTPELDGNALCRLVEYEERRDELWAETAEQVYVEGSKKQLRANPLFDEVHRLESEIQKLEQQLGLTLRARLAAGLTLLTGEALVRKENDRLNAKRSYEDPRPEDDEAPE